MNSEEWASVIITVIIILVITAALAFAHNMDNDVKYFRMRCEAQNGVVILSTPGLICVDKKIVIEKK